MKTEKRGYICSALTELSPHDMEAAKLLYSSLADRLAKSLGLRPWVPHEHYDPIRNRDFTPAQIKAAEKQIICEQTSFLLVVALEPTWGGGIEVGWAEDRGIPILSICPRLKLDARLISRLLRGCSTEVAAFDDFEDALEVAEELICTHFQISRGVNA